MSLELAPLRAAVATHGAVVRVVIVAHQGSTPRETGTAMLVWPSGQHGTIGGGALEFDATAQARALLAAGRSAQVARIALGPALGQCCGGAVTLVHERFDAQVMNLLADTRLHARRITGQAARPRAIAHAQWRAAHAQDGAPALIWTTGWLAELVAPAPRRLWIWGAGHVGRAIATTLAPLPDLALTWIDTAPDRFPDPVPEGIDVLTAACPAALVAQAPRDAGHLILTYSHALDLALCDRLLRHGFASAGLIGSASKRARFCARLRALGHSDAQIARIRCPIGDPMLGKHPQAIAVGVAAALLRAQPAAATESTG